MKKDWIALSLIVLATFGAGGAENPADISLDKRDITNPFIYEVKKDGWVSYLFGSFHHGFGTEQLPYWVTRLHRNAELHAYEMIVTSFSDFSALQSLRTNPAKAVADLGLAPNNFPEDVIQKLLDLGFTEQIARVADNCNILFYRHHYLSQTFSSFDYEFQLYSIKFNRPILELEDDTIRETAAAQIPPYQCDMREQLESGFLSDIDGFLKRFEEEYHSGKVLEDSQYDDDDEDIFYRNRMWLPKLVDAFSKKRTFVVVGFRHLYGKKGLLKLLEGQGFQVKRLTSDPGDPPGANHNFER